VLQLLAAVLVTLVLLIVVELVAQRFVPPEPGYVLGRGNDFVVTTLGNLDLVPELNPSPLIRDPYVLWRNKPLAQKTQPINPRVFGRDASWTVAINSEGYRGDEREFRNHGDVYRILCVGDSVTFGFNVEQADTYPRRLEALLRQRHPGRAIEVVNAGVPGWSWVQGLRFLEAEGMRLEPDLVVAAHGVNDQFFLAQVTDRERLPVGGRPAPEISLRDKPFYTHTATYRGLALLAGRLPRGPVMSPACEVQVRERGVCRRVAVADIAATLREMYGVVRGRGTDFLALNLDFQETMAVDGVRRALAEEPMAFIDFVERFRALRRADERARAARLHLAEASTASDGTPPPDRPRRVVFRVLVDPPPAGVPVRVRGHPWFRDEIVFERVLLDDGNAPDERARDGVYSGAVEYPPVSGAVEYRFWLGDTAEFTPLPPLPSSGADRLLRSEGDTVAGVVAFADMFMMAERTHPDRRGAAEIAAGVLAHVEQAPSFVAWRNATAGGGTR
jgi:lysophospholipase L1-like esterase